MTASDAPARRAGLHTRSGNAMLRTRAAILDAAGTCIERSGVRRTTMSEIAATGGVAKATLYNHFRTKDDVLSALVEARVSALGADGEQTAAGAGLPAALEQAAAALAVSPPLRRVAAEEPALLAPLAAAGPARGWTTARTAVEGVLAAAGAPAGPAEVELVLRWLVSQLLWPCDPAQAAAAASALARGLSGPAAGASCVPSQGRSSERAQSAGLGWPAGPARLRTRQDERTGAP